MLKHLTITLNLLALTLPIKLFAAPIVFEVGGSNNSSSIQSTVDSFRAALGNPNNGNASGPLFSGRREINWDGGGSTANAAVGTPFNGFQNIRGGQFVTPGTGFVQAPASASGSSDDLGTFFGNATYDTTFGSFSLVRLFVPVGSNITDALFFIPGTAGSTPATVSGFGAVFTDVDLADSTKIEFFDIFGNVLLDKFVQPGTVADQSLSFLGVIFDAGERIARVRITTGTAPLSGIANDNPGSGIDLVAMDDFLYSEPLQVPEPATWTLFGSSAMTLVMAGAVQRRRVRRLCENRGPKIGDQKSGTVPSFPFPAPPK